VASVLTWIVKLNESHHVAFAALTVLTMAASGSAIALAAELFFKALGIKSKKIEMHH
jgi:hypothetical protein